MNHKIKQIVIIVTISLIWVGCKEAPTVNYTVNNQYERLEINDSIPADKSIEAFIEPYHNHLNNTLDEPLSYTPVTLNKSEGKYNTAIGNLMTDVVTDRLHSLLPEYQIDGIDIVLLNHGGIRSVISKGNISTRNAYEVMPFENELVLLELQGKAIHDMVAYLVRSSSPHPFKGLQIERNEQDDSYTYTIQGQEPQEEQWYTVATIDYLANKGDYMDFFANARNRVDTGYKLRNALIDYLKVTDTIQPYTDDRMTLKR